MSYHREGAKGQWEELVDAIKNVVKDEAMAPCLAGELLFMHGANWEREVDELENGQALHDYLMGQGFEPVLNDVEPMAWDWVHKALGVYEI
jgi:hypothetical protein